MKNTALAAIFCLCAAPAFAGDTEIVGTVQSKCSIFTDTQGVYGAPIPSRLSTNTFDGGVQPRIRFDVSKAGYYTAKIATPNAFTSSPALSDTVAWDGDVYVDEMTDANMSVFETTKVKYDNVTEFDLSIEGSVWFSAESTADYGYDKSFPGGQYKSVVSAECIAK